MNGLAGRLRLWPLLVTLLFLVLAQHASVAKANPAVIHVPQDYATIPAAVDAASPGDTIIVAGGTYPGNINITKSINLTGVSSSSVTIDAAGSSPGMLIANTTRVSISGFTIQNTAFYAGIEIFQSSSVTMLQNRLQSSANGTYIFNSNTVTVRNNTFTGNAYGVSILGGYSNVLQKNNITGNSIGLALFNSTGNRITDNLLDKNQDGVEFWSGSSGNVLGRNMIANNTSNGIFLSNSGTNWIIENNVEYTNKFSYSTGIHVEKSLGNIVFYNNIRSNALQMYGVTVPGDLAGSTWNDRLSHPRGNYWSDYTGADDGSGGRVAGDGVGDTRIPHPCPNGGRPCSYFNGTAGVDWYPLMSPFTGSTLNATASASPLSGYPPLTVAFTGIAAGGVPPYSYSWNLGDMSNSLTQNVTHIYGSSGIFVATLTVTDSAGTNSTDSVPVTVLVKYGALVIHVEDLSRKPVVGANITSLSQPPGQARFTGKANNLGIAAWVRLTPGLYSVQASSPDLSASTIQVTVIFNQTVNYPISLVPLPAGSQTPLILAGGGVVAAAVLLGAFLVLRRRRRRPEGRKA